jgi:hypothetical protein
LQLNRTKMTCAQFIEAMEELQPFVPQIWIKQRFYSSMNALKVLSGDEEEELSVYRLAPIAAYLKLYYKYTQEWAA